MMPKIFFKYFQIFFLHIFFVLRTFSIMSHHIFHIFDTIRQKSGHEKLKKRVNFPVLAAHFFCRTIKHLLSFANLFEVSLTRTYVGAMNGLPLKMPGMKIHGEDRLSIQAS